MPVRLVVALVVAALAVAAVGAWLWPGRDLPRPAALRAEPTSALYALVDSRQADAAPLTTAELFTPATQTLGALTRDAVEEFTDCDDALWGASAPGCTQALRATYTGAAIAGQFVIFNLPDGRTADALVTALRKDGFVRQAVPFDAARSRAEVRALGHFVTVSWAGSVAGGADLVQPLIALDALGHAVQARVLAAT
ncbi:hypothetical protein [Nonomuraea sp. LPB2021202275-12-8]|uniref:hypothetical protein n=1 Tax=Nonomuraea sp. LPB2021202275-12-8 TaxID=3120159 RepID=UPI00300D2180